MDNFEEFVSSLNKKPVFLFLGQSYLKLETGTDAFLSEIGRKYCREKIFGTNYNSLFECDLLSTNDAALAWMDERCKRISIPTWLTTVASFTWSGVYTSAIDSIWPSEFRNAWRDIHPLFEEKYRPSDPRNKLTLHCSFLFGSVNRTEITERPPLTHIEYAKRRQIAISLAKSLPEYLTPLGLLLIEGYDVDDWFSPDDIFPVIDELDINQAHLFSVTDRALENPLIRHLIQSKKLVAHKESLASAILQGEHSGFLKLGTPPDTRNADRSIGLKEKTIYVPREIWNQVSQSAIILDDNIIQRSPIVSEESQYQNFRTFLSESGIRPIWSGYANGYAFLRHFENILYSKVERELKTKILHDIPIILHGQTCTGKTIALGRLAYEVYRKLNYPVLFIERKLGKPLVSHIDQFCKWAEDNGDTSTLIVWDGMVEPKEYYDFLRSITSRGRKVVLVGSCYRQQISIKKGDSFIEAQAQLEDSEIGEFKIYLGKFVPNSDILFASTISTKESAYLATLYRLLPPTRSLIKTGLSKELSHIEHYLNETSAKIVPEYQAPNAIAQALMRAGLIKQEQLLTSIMQSLGGEEYSDFQYLIGLIMVPSRFGLVTPIELLLRAWGKKGLLHLNQYLSKIDIVRFAEDSSGNIFVGARNQLEAQILTQTRIGGVEGEIDLIKKLLLEVRGSFNKFEDDREIGFALDLLHSVGAQSSDAEHYSKYFVDLADTLKKLREERSIIDPRLMLQEANLLRESIKYIRTGNQNKYKDIDSLLDDVEEILQRALSLLDVNNKTRTLRANIMNELAATYGSKCSNALEVLEDPNKALILFQKAEHAARDATSLRPDSYYPIDIQMWTTRDMLKANMFNDEQRAEAIANVLYAYEMADLEEFDIGHLERYYSRRLEFTDIIGNIRLSEDAFLKLQSIGSSAGYYIRAKQIINKLGVDLDGTSIKKIQEAVSYLESHHQEISHDSRCLDLLLELWWMLNCGVRIFSGERKSIPFNTAQWQYLLRILTELEYTAQSRRPLVIKYLKGIALFHLNRTGESTDIFRELEQESDQVHMHRRTIRSYLSSTESGEPRKYHGTIKWLDANMRKGELTVDEIRGFSLKFIPSDFYKTEAKRGDPIGEFHIAFNFIGTIADPLHFYKGIEKENA